jgi:two-component system, OmpR family, phosphate regulon sensor histidine kinase PhoR
MNNFSNDLPDISNFKDEIISHLIQELRTPLSNIKTALKLLESPLLKQVQRQRYLDMIGGECERQNSLINGAIELLALENNQQNTALTAIKLAEILPGVVSTYQPLAEEKGVNLGYTIPEDLPMVIFVEGWLRQIAINLLHNGIKYTSSGGSVFLQASLQGDYIQLEFRDTGIGIASSDIPKIFERFYRGRNLLLDESNNGAGLGLTIVQNILLRCGGSISVTSQLGEGSQFRVLLPLYSTGKVQIPNFLNQSRI